MSFKSFLLGLALLLIVPNLAFGSGTVVVNCYFEGSNLTQSMISSYVKNELRKIKDVSISLSRPGNCELIVLTQDIKSNNSDPYGVSIAAFCYRLISENKADASSMHYYHSVGPHSSLSGMSRELVRSFDAKVFDSIRQIKRIRTKPKKIRPLESEEKE